MCSLLPTILSAQVDTAWVRRYNGPGNSDDEPAALVVDDLGNVYVTGSSIGVGTSWDYLTIKYNPLGDTQWIRRYNGPGNGNDYAAAIALDGQGNVYVTGQNVTIKYNTFGDTQWVRSYSSYGYAVRAMVIDDLGNIYVTGWCGDDSFATIKYNPFGDTQWVARYQEGEYTNPKAIGVDDSGNVFVTGGSYYWGGGTHYYTWWTTVKYNSSGIRQWAIDETGFFDNWSNPNDIAVDDSGNVYVTGQINLYYLTEFTTVKYSSSGVRQWFRSYNLGYSSVANAITLDRRRRNVYVTGQSRISDTSEDYVTIKYNSSGESLWTQRYNGPENSTDNATDIMADDSGNAYVTGISGSDYATVKYNTTGVQQWVARYNGPANSTDEAKAIAVDNLGNVYVTGSSTGSGTSYDYATIKYFQYTGIEEHPTPDLKYVAFKIYPNPAKSFLAIRLPQIAEHQTIKIFDVSGKLVKVTDEVTSPQSHKQEVKISLKGISPGIYFLRLGKETKKFLVVK
jgi:hypothetical protein